MGIAIDPTVWYYHDPKVTITYYHDIVICWVLRNHILRFSANHFPKVKFCEHHLFHPIWFIFPFYCIFYYLTSEQLAPSSGLKSPLIFIIIQKVEFVFATFVENLFNKISILLWIDSILSHKISRYYDVSIVFPYLYYFVT